MARRKHIWLLSDGRSGSTWMSGLINARGDFREYFEPLHSARTPEFSGEPLIPYARGGAAALKYVAFYRRVFAGEFALEGCGPSGPADGPIIVKDIHALLIARATLDGLADVRPICLVRHPLDVARSKLALDDWTWLREPAQLLQDRALAEDWLAPYEAHIRAAQRPFEKYVALWAILHLVFSRSVGEALYIRYDADPARLKQQVDDVRASAGLPALAPGEFARAYLARSRTAAARPKPEATPAERDYADAMIESFGLRGLLGED